jgi:hypothetical protein
MEKFEWVPTLEERVQMVRNIFPESSLSQADIQILVNECEPNGNCEPGSHPGVALSVGSFATIRYRLYKGEVMKMIKNVPLPDVLSHVFQEEIFERGICPDTITLDAVRTEARSLVRDGILRNHLGS